MTEKIFYANDVIAGVLQNVVEKPNKETSSFVINMDDNGTDGSMTVWAGAYQRIIQDKDIFVRENQNDGINIYRHETRLPQFIRPKIILAGHASVNYNPAQFYPWQLGGDDLRIVVCDEAKKFFYTDKYFTGCVREVISKEDYKLAIAGLQNTNAPAQEEVVDAKVVDENQDKPLGQGDNSESGDSNKKPGLMDRLREKGKKIKAKRKNKKSKKSTQEIVDEEEIPVAVAELDPVDSDPVVINVDPENPTAEQNDNDVRPDDNVQPGDVDPVIVNTDPVEEDEELEKKSKVNGKTLAIGVAAAALLAAGVWFFGGKRGGDNSNSDVTPVVPVDTIPAPAPVDTVPVVDTNNIQPVVKPNKPPKLVRRDSTIWQPGYPQPAHIKRRATYRGR